MFDGQSLISPAKFSGLVAWWDASKITGLNDNDAVSSWPDLSGHGYDLVQSTVTYQPLYKMNAQNGLPVIQFDGINDYLISTFGTTYTQPNTIIAVGKFNSGSTYQFAYDGIAAGNRHVLGIYWPYFSYLYAGTISATNFVDGIAGNWGLINARYDGANSFLRSNRSFTSSGNLGTNPLTGLTLGCSVELTAPFNGEIAEFMIYNKVLSFYERYQIETYLSKKWGIQNFTTTTVDDFTRADNTTTMGSCRSNQTWTAGSYQDANLPTIGISSNHGCFVSTPGTDSHAWVETGVSDCIITCQIKFDTGVDSDKGVLFRRVDANNYWYAHINSANDNLVISRCLAGVRADIASVASATTALGNENYWRIFLAGGYISAGASQNQKYVTVVDTNLQTGTKHGLYNASGNQAAFGYFAVEI